MALALARSLHGRARMIPTRSLDPGAAFGAAALDDTSSSPIKASVVATREIGLAVLATTLSLVAVFLPVAFMSGIVGGFLKSLGMTMACSILVSTLVSFTTPDRQETR
jgi:Cu/Ag efflux pump CusA